MPVPYFRPFGAPRPCPHRPHLVLLVHGGRPSQAGPRADGGARRAIRPGVPGSRGVSAAAAKDPDPARCVAEDPGDGAPERPRLQRLLLSRNEDGPVGNGSPHRRAEPRLHGDPGTGRPRRGLWPAARRGLLLAVAGLFVVVRFGTDKAVDWPYLSSALLLALAPLSWAIYTVVGRTLPPGADPLDTSYALLFVGSLPLLVFARPSTLKTLLSSPGALGAALYLAVPCTLLAWVSFLWALKRLPAGEAASFVFLNPPLANLLGVALRGAKLRLPFLLGAAILLAGVGSHRSSRPSKA